MRRVYMAMGEKSPTLNSHLILPIDPHKGTHLKCEFTLKYPPFPFSIISYSTLSLGFRVKF